MYKIVLKFRKRIGVVVMIKVTSNNHRGKNKGFTLIELLAVIVILAVIALIATPIILSILTKVRKSAFQDSAYGIMEAAKSYFAESILEETDPVDQVFSFEDGASNELSYSGSKPKGGILTLSKSGEIALAIHNNEWCAIKSKTDTNVRLIKYEKDKCKIPDGSDLPLISVKDSKSETIEKGLDKSILEYFNVISGSARCVDTSNENVEVNNTSSLSSGTHCIECTVVENGNTVSANKTIVVESLGKVLTEEMMTSEVGENGTIRTDNLGNKRYAGSNPNNWVCFGTENKTCDENHLYRIIGVIDGKMKIIKNSFYSTALRWDTTGGTYGSNNWDRPATLKTELNGTSFYSNSNYIDEVSRSYIANGTWYTGGAIYPNATLADFEDAERSSSSQGYIGLMSVTDFGYGSNNASCERTTNLNTTNNACISNNYLLNSSTYQWTITPNSGLTYGVWFVRTEGYVDANTAHSTSGVRPVLYLESDVKVTDGDGTTGNPYRLSK